MLQSPAFGSMGNHCFTAWLTVIALPENSLGFSVLPLDFCSLGDLFLAQSLLRATAMTLMKSQLSCPIFRPLPFTLSLCCATPVILLKARGKELAGRYRLALRQGLLRILSCNSKPYVSIKCLLNFCSFLLCLSNGFFFRFLLWPGWKQQQFSYNLERLEIYVFSSLRHSQLSDGFFKFMTLYIIQILCIERVRRTISFDFLYPNQNWIQFLLIIEQNMEYIKALNILSNTIK